MKTIIFLLLLITSCQKCKECTTITVIKTKTGAFLEKDERKDLVCGRKQIDYIDQTYTKEVKGDYIIETHVNCN
jgi:hypothetical protein